MASEIRVNTFKNRSGFGTITVNDDGANFSGIVTAASFSGNVTGNLTGTASTATAAATAYGISGSPTLSGISSVSTTNLTVNGNAYPSAGPLSNRNLIINGAMQVAQRGTSTTSVSTSNYYACDRWRLSIGSLGTWTVQQSTDAPDGFISSFRLLCTTADASPAAGDIVSVQQRIEAQDLQHIFTDKSAGATSALTLSFWVKASRSGDASFSVFQVDNSGRQFNASYNIGAADTWEYKTISIPADDSAVINNDNGIGLQVMWHLHSGSNYTGGTQSANWEANTYANQNVNNLGIGQAVNDDFLITGVQLEVGEVATPFEHRSYGDELARCQRYYKQVLALQGFTSQTFFTSHYGTTDAINVIEAGLYNMRSGVNVSLGPVGNTGNVQYYSYGGVWSSSTLTVTTLGTYPHQQIYLYSTADGDGRGKLLRRSGASDPNIYVEISAEL